jgi:RNA recognition motif-containing protein
VASASAEDASNNKSCGGAWDCPEDTYLTGGPLNIYVGNLAPQVSEAELLELFKPFGQVESLEIKRDLFTGTSKGFGFVEMPGKAHSLAAIAGLNGKDLGGQPLRVNESRPRASSPRRR